MKKIFRYLLLLIAVIIVVRIYVYFLTKPYYKDMNNYKILVQTPKIEVTESKADKNRGYIQGTAQNDTGEMMKDTKIKFDFYDENEKYIGSEYHNIGVFNVGEKSKFDIKYRYKNVSKITISIVNQ